MEAATAPVACLGGRPLSDVDAAGGGERARVWRHGAATSGSLRRGFPRRTAQADLAKLTGRGPFSIQRP